MARATAPLLRVICVAAAVVACCTFSVATTSVTNSILSTPHGNLDRASLSGGLKTSPAGPISSPHSTEETEPHFSFPNVYGESSPLTENSSLFEECSCGTQDNTCTCKAPYGHINFPNTSDSRTYNFDVGSNGTISVMVWVDKYEVSGLDDSNCYFSVGNTNFSDSTLLSNVTTVYITTDDSIIIHSQDAVECAISLLYAAVAPKYIVEDINETEGSITFLFPGDGEPYPWGYPFQQRLQYNFNYADNNVIELEITHQDLGYSSAGLHTYPNWNNFSTNDFLLIGAGTEILEDKALLFYGNASSSTKILLSSSTGYVVFYGAYHEQTATGFTIRYSAVTDTRPTPPTTLPPPPTSHIPPTAWASIDGVMDSYSTLAEMNTSFQATVASVATEYINETGMTVDPPPVVSPSDVLVYAVATCSPTMCGDECVAFNFSINKTDGAAWAFSQHDLETMVRDSDLQDAWSGMCEGCAFCHEVVTVPWWELGSLLLMLLVMAAVLAAVAWRMSGRSSSSKAQDEYDAMKEVEWDDTRRLSSTQVSVIGALRSSSHRRSLPFRRGKPVQELQFSVENYDVAGFSMYDPDGDVVEFELEHDKSYANVAYVDDEDVENAPDFWGAGHRRRSLEDALERGGAAPLAEGHDADASGGTDEGDVNRWAPRPAVVKVIVHDHEYGEETEL